MVKTGRSGNNSANHSSHPTAGWEVDPDLSVLGRSDTRGPFLRGTDPLFLSEGHFSTSLRLMRTTSIWATPCKSE